MKNKTYLEQFLKYRKRNYNNTSRKNESTLTLFQDIVNYLIANPELQNLDTVKKLCNEDLSILIKSIITELRKNEIPQKNRNCSLTPREEEALNYIAENYNYNQIMQKMKISKGTLQMYIGSICTKYQIHDNIGIKALRQFLF